MPGTGAFPNLPPPASSGSKGNLTLSQRPRPSRFFSGWAREAPRALYRVRAHQILVPRSAAQGRVHLGGRIAKIKLSPPIRKSQPHPLNPSTQAAPEAAPAILCSAPLGFQSVPRAGSAGTLKQVRVNRGAQGEGGRSARCHSPGPAPGRPPRVHGPGMGAPTLLRWAEGSSGP